MIVLMVRLWVVRFFLRHGSDRGANAALDRFYTFMHKR